MATHKNKPVKPTQADRWPRTISAPLFKQWKKLYRQGDVEEVMKALPEGEEKSRPTIYRALKYGHVNQQVITDTINSFFTKRLEDELGTAKQLAALNQEIVKANAA